MRLPTSGACVTDTTGAADAAKLQRQLSALRQAHERLLAAMADLDGLTKNGVVDESYIHIRFRLSAASLARRRLWQHIFRGLKPLVSGSDTDTLADLNTADLQLLRRSAEHVCTWSSQTVERRWREYAQASKLLRRDMAEAIGDEKRLLYPLLAKYAALGAAGMEASARNPA